jgi:hypothetical protein
LVGRVENVRAVVNELAIGQASSTSDRASDVLVAAKVVREVAVEQLEAGRDEEVYGLCELYRGDSSQVKIARSVTHEETTSLRGPAMLRLMERLANQLPDIHLHWRTFDQFWSLLVSLSSLGLQEATYMIKKHVLFRVLKFYHEATKKGPKPFKMGDKFTRPRLDDVAALIISIMLMCDPISTDHRLTPSGATSPVIVLDAAEEMDTRSDSTGNTTFTQIALDPATVRLFFAQGNDGDWMLREHLGKCAVFTDLLVHLCKSDKMFAFIVNRLITALESWTAQCHGAIYEQISCIAAVKNDVGQLRLLDVANRVIQVHYFF